MVPTFAIEARALLHGLGASRRFIRHVELVGEAADRILEELDRLGVGTDAAFVRVGVALHDAGKILHPAELDEPGDAHEPAGEALLLQRGVTPQLARVCRSHARWHEMPVSFEELLIALADKLWKGVRRSELEERVIDAAAERLGKAWWDVYVQLDSVFERAAADGEDRLRRSRL